MYSFNFFLFFLYYYLKGNCNNVRILHIHYERKKKYIKKTINIHLKRYNTPLKKYIKIHIPNLTKPQNTKQNKLIIQNTTYIYNTSLY